MSFASFYIGSFVLIKLLVERLTNVGICARFQTHKYLLETMRSSIKILMAVLLIVAIGNVSANSLKQVEVNGIKMDYVEQGDGPLIVLLHGALGNYKSWIKHMPALSQNYRVVSVSQRYYGSNDWDDSAPKANLRQMASDVAAFIKVINNGEPAHVAGWSMGSRVLHQAVLDHPEAIRSAYLFEGTAVLEVDAETQKNDKEYFGSHFKSMGAAMKTGDRESVANELLKAVSSGKTSIDDFDDAGKERISESHDGMWKWLTRDRMAPIACEKMALTDVPINFVYGKDTMFTDLTDGRFDECLGSNAIFEVVDGDHLWPNDHDAFTKSLSAFAKKH